MMHQDSVFYTQMEDAFGSLRFSSSSIKKEIKWAAWKEEEEWSC